MGRSTTSSTRGRTAPRRERPPEFDTELDVGHLLRIALAVFGVLAIVIAVWILIPRSASYGGPLQDPDLSGSSSTGVKRAAGKAVSFGIFLPWNAGEQDAVLDKLVPLSTSEGLQIVGAGALTPVDDGVGAAEGYPPAGMLKPPPVRGYVIPPGSSALDSYQIVVGVRAKEPGVHTIPGFEIQYHVGGTSYRAVVLQGVWICVPREEKPACPGKSDIVDQQQELRASLGSLVKGP